jgi:phosphatidylserine/phosphatidylglycerophosphate/cardiolipin synthase-like enzyme/uncharacterized membrane protein YdjX (TVP38/TMEM64 family)
MHINEGEHCWRISHNNDAELLIDGDAYFSSFRNAVISARKRICISAWDLDSRILLQRTEKKEDDYPSELGPLLLEVLKRNRQLRIFVLLWDFAMIYALERDWSPVFNNAHWCRHRRLHLVMDGTHPVGASHHQKIVTVDGIMAFVGGMDLGKWRWDTSHHRAKEPHRKDPNGKTYPPFHDVQIKLSGSVVKDLDSLFSTRWYYATGKSLDQNQVSVPQSAKSVNNTIADLTIAIARTWSVPGSEEQIREVERLHRDAIRNAQNLIYIENQYLSSSLIGNEIIKRLKTKSCPEIVIIVPAQTGGWLEQMTMDILRERLLLLFKLADRYEQLFIAYPDNKNLTEDVISVHSKLFIVDDKILKVGSSNLSNRSMTIDSECDVVLIAGNDHEKISGIQKLRHRLIAEHLGIPVDTFSRKESELGSMLSAIHSLNQNNKDRSLTALNTKINKNQLREISNMNIVDPEQPMEPDRVIEYFLGKTDKNDRKMNRIKFLSLLLALLFIGLIWHISPLSDVINRESIVSWFGDLEHPAWQHFYFILSFTVLGVIGVPVTILIGATGMLFGPVWGGLIALLSSSSSAGLSYMIGHFTGKNWIRNIAGEKINRISKKLSKRGMWTIIIVRIVPIAPYALINLVAGASHVRFKDYMLGTLIGMIPGILVLSTFFGHLTYIVQNVSTKDIVTLILLLTTILGFTVLAVKYIQQKYQ